MRYDRFKNNVFLAAGILNGQSSEMNPLSGGSYKCRAINKAGKTFSAPATIAFICLCKWILHSLIYSNCYKNIN